MGYGARGKGPKEKAKFADISLISFLKGTSDA
jgi:hypothetical protein